MYQPAHFNVTDTAALHALIEAHPFGTWATTLDGALEMNHLPFLLDRSRGPHGTLVGHVARANAVWKGAGPSIVAFTGPQAYVSPNWYPSKHAHGKAVPTWNYAVVQAHGVPRAIEDRSVILQIVTRLTQTHEAAQALPWQVSDAPADYIESMLAAIVGIEIPIERLVGKWKISQNRAPADMQGVAAGLASVQGPHGADAQAVAALMQQPIPK